MMPNRINLGLLSRAELELIRAKIAGGSFDELDAGALLDHIDAVAAERERLVQSGNRDEARSAEIPDGIRLDEALRAIAKLVTKQYTRFGIDPNATIADINKLVTNALAGRVREGAR
jgi:hypothetical protein